MGLNCIASEGHVYGKICPEKTKNNNKYTNVMYYGSGTAYAPGRCCMYTHQMAALRCVKNAA